MLNAVFSPFQCYGLQDYVSGAIEEVLTLADVYVARENGIDIPYPEPRVKTGLRVNNRGDSISSGLRKLLLRLTFSDY